MDSIILVSLLALGIISNTAWICYLIIKVGKLESKLNTRLKRYPD